jgi:sugar diacid utilization regulator
MDAREHLAKLQGLFVLAQLMAESRDEDNLLHLAGSAVPSLGSFQLLGIHLSTSGWHERTDVSGAILDRSDVEAQLAELTGGTGSVVVAGCKWAWAFGMRSLDGLIGHLVIAADSEPTAWSHFLLGTLAQQTAIAVATARLYAHQRAQANELREANAALAATVAALKRSTSIHERLTQVAVAGEGEQGIVEALFELTQWPVAIEDRYGNLRAWGGPGVPDPYPKQPRRLRDELLRRALEAGRPIHDSDRLLTVASPRPDVVGVIAVVGVPPGQAEAARSALEHGATVLAMELARLHSVAETELRLGRDLVEELLANTDERAALSRAEALEYDLRRPHRVAIVVRDAIERHTAPDWTFHAVQRAARDANLGTLVVPRGDAVVVLAYSEEVWPVFHRQLVTEIGEDVWVGVGGICERPGDFFRSHSEAKLALRMRSTTHASRHTIFYDQLGTYQLLAEVGDISVIDDFVERWLGRLITYDLTHSAELVSTLSSYLECRGNYDTTSAVLCVHRNTLKYRLGRIREISSHDLKDPDTLFNLQLATRAWSTRQALNAGDNDVGSGGSAASGRAET